MLVHIYLLICKVYPVASGKALELFKCQKIDNIYYLMSDYSVKCYTSEWFQYLVIVILFLIIFTIGLPIGVALYLKIHVNKLNENRFKNRFQIFYRLYRKDVYWFESVSMLFKLALWSSLVFFPYKSGIYIFI